jgi:hypothetical protein
MEMVSFILQGKSPWHPISRRLGKPKRWFRHFREDKNPLPQLGIKPNQIP